MNTNQPLKKMIVGVLLSGGVALAGLGLTAGTAGAAPANPGPTIDHSDFRHPRGRVHPVPAHPSRRRFCARQPGSQVGRRLGTGSHPLRRPLNGTGNTVWPATGSLVAGRIPPAAIVKPCASRAR
jgi:hypothetical protein